MRKKYNLLLGKKGHFWFGVIAIILVGLSYKLIPYARMSSNETADNPHNCPYYITLQSILAGYPLLAHDKANLSLIKRKMAKFERNIKNSSNSTDIVVTYKNQYYQALQLNKITSINSVLDEEKIIQIAKQTAPIIDNYYLDKRIYCINPLYDWHGTPTVRRILRYNLNGLYDQIPSKYSTILAAVSDDWLTGSSPEFFLINQTTTMDTRFMTGMPLLTALYALPKYDFVKVGTYASPAHWGYFRANSFIDPISRKALDVAGVDILTVTDADLGKKIIPHTSPLPSNIHPIFKSWQSFINNNSYSLAYIANNITYISSEDVNKKEKMIKHYFSKHDNPALFTQMTNELYQQLMKLKQKHDVILETTAPFHEIQSKVGSSVNIEGIVGERAFFTTECLNKTCMFIFNISEAPGWHAFVNGNSSEILRANFAFMATQIPHGHATVWFIYSPLADEITYFMSILFLLGLMVISIKKIRNNH